MGTFLQILILLGAVTLFLFGLGLLGGGLQKVAGDRLRAFVGRMVSNPFKQILGGIGVTAAVQSSTATTIMVAGFANAGLLAVGQAVGVVMGANIGTTLAPWILAGLGFSLDTAILAFPVLAVGFLLTQTRSDRSNDIGELLIGFALLFIGLAQLRATAQALLPAGSTLPWTGLGGWSVVLFLLIGIVVAACFQSSVATMAMAMVLALTGALPFAPALALVLGANIGTTATPLVASFKGNTAARRTAVSHTMFNVAGACLVLCVFPLWVKLVGAIVSMCGLPDPGAAGFAGPASGAQARASMLVGLCTAHTLFNVLATLLLAWFIPWIVKLAGWIFPQKGDSGRRSRLRYISGGPQPTDELSLEEARQEIAYFGEVCHGGFAHIREAVGGVAGDQFGRLRDKLVGDEETTDRIEYEIATYLGEVSRGDISERSASRIKAMYRIIGEMESLGDSGEAIGRMLQRARDHSGGFDSDQMGKLGHMLDLVDKAYGAMLVNLRADDPESIDLSAAAAAERDIDGYRDTLREEHISNVELNPAYDYQRGVFYIDVVAELERMGDYIINISQALRGEDS